MDQNLTDDIFGESGVNEDVPLRNANIEGETSYTVSYTHLTLPTTPYV